MGEVLLYIADDAVIKHDGCEDVDAFDPGKVDLHIYAAGSEELKGVVAYYFNAFPDVEDFFGEEQIDIFAERGWYVLKVGYDEKTDRYVAMLGTQIGDDCAEYRIIWFDGSHEQFLIRSAQITSFLDNANDYFESTGK